MPIPVVEPAMTKNSETTVTTSMNRPPPPREGMQTPPQGGDFALSIVQKDMTRVGVEPIAMITPPVETAYLQEAPVPKIFHEAQKAIAPPAPYLTPPADTLDPEEIPAQKAADDTVPSPKSAPPPSESTAITTTALLPTPGLRNQPTVSTVTSTTTTPYLLLVDDNAINLRILSMHATRLGCKYVAATNGLEALEAVKASAQPFDYIFMDISMPVMNGFVASREIRAWERAERKAVLTTIVALTGLGSQLSQQEAFSSGINLYWTKPVKLGALTELLKGQDG